MSESTTVLLIEDDASLREVLTVNLTDFGFTVESATTGAEGVALFDPARHDVVLTDMRMPGMDGLEVLDAILARDPDAVVIMITAYGGKERALEAMRCGAFHFVEKPVNTRSLVAELRRAVDHRRDTTPSPTAAASEMIASSPAMNEVMRTVDKIADSDAPVMILGESGVGKELVARAIHARSARAQEPFVAVNCAAIPGELLESTLFGYEEGAFTGATSRRAGKFIAADGGTLFLDEIAEMPEALQSKLLRVVQDGYVERVGSVDPERVDVRILTATHQDLEARMTQGAFRRDLYYRLYVVPITLPPLRARPEDIPVLMRHFLRQLASHPQVSFAPAVDDVFLSYEWPGNVRELRNVVERMVLLRDGDTLGIADIPAEIRAAASSGGATVADDDEDALPFELPEEGLDLMELERRIIVAALRKTQGNQSAAARYLGLPRHVLLYRLEKFAIDTDAME